MRTFQSCLSFAMALLISVQALAEGQDFSIFTTPALKLSAPTLQKFESDYDATRAESITAEKHPRELSTEELRKEFPELGSVNQELIHEFLVRSEISLVLIKQGYLKAGEKEFGYSLSAAADIWTELGGITNKDRRAEVYEALVFATYSAVIDDLDISRAEKSRLRAELDRRTFQLYTKSDLKKLYREQRGADRSEFIKKAWQSAGAVGVVVIAALFALSYVPLIDHQTFNTIAQAGAYAGVGIGSGIFTHLFYRLSQIKRPWKRKNMAPVRAGCKRVFDEML